MKGQLKKYIAAISLLCLLAIPIITYSCGPELEPTDAVFRLFMPKYGQPSLLPFNYTPALTSSVTSDSASVSPDGIRNCEEWRKFTNNNATLHDIYLLQVDTDPDDFLYAYTTNNWTKFEGNSFTDWLRKKKNRKALNYFAFAKKVEFVQTAYRNTWEEEQPKSDIALYDSLSNAAKKLAAQTKSDFLANRYAFQAVKLTYYTKLYSNFTYENEDVVNYYDTHLKGKNTVVADWALVYYALSHPDILERNYYLAQVFDRTEEKKDYAYLWFNKEALDTLSHTLTDVNDIVLIRTIQSMMNPGRGLEDLKYIVSKQPDSKYIPLLVTREINKLEDWIWSPEILGFTSQLKENLYLQEKYANGTGSSGNDTNYYYYLDKNLQKDRTYLDEVKSYLSSTINTSAHKDFLNLALAHLANMQGKHTEAVTRLSKIGSKANKNLVRQAHIEQVLAIANSEDIKSEATKEKIYQLVHTMNVAGDSLKHTNYWDYNGDNEQQDDLSELFELLSKRYQQEGDLVTAGLLHYNAGITTNQYGYTCQDIFCYGTLAFWDKFGSPTDIDAIIALKYKNTKTNFEQMISPNVWADDDFYLDLKGTLYLRQQKYDDALRTFEAMPDSFWNNSYEYASYLPKTTLTTVGTLLPVNTGTGKEYPIPSKKLLIKEIVGIQHALAIAKTDKEKAKLHFMLGNAEYNMSYYGISWMMTAYGKSSGGSYSADNNNYNWVYYALYNSPNNHTENYYGCESSMKHYQKALSLANTNKELSAQCLIMLSLCDNINKSYMRERNTASGISNYSNDEKTTYSGYLKILTHQFSNTRTFTLSKTTCPDIMGYLDKN